MELTNEFTVPLPVDDAWMLLTDLERIAPCMPGAQLQEVEGDDYRGVVKVKVGPIVAQYKGTARFLSQDSEARVAVLSAEGRETRGQGNASATITASVTPAGHDSHVRVVTDLTVTGKVAQFGRSVLTDVSAKLLTQFVERLEADLGSDSGERSEIDADQSDDGEAQHSDSESVGPSRRRINSAPAEPIDLIATARPSSAVTAALAGLLALLLSVIWLRRRRRRRR